MISAAARAAAHKDLPGFRRLYIRMQAEEIIERELMLSRFQKLISELLRGAIVRNVFQPWEVAILLDLENCWIQPRKRHDVLRQYQKAVERQLETGPGPPMRLSEFLASRTRRGSGGEPVEPDQESITRRPTMP